MPAFLVDEDLPRSLAAELRKTGHEAVDVRDIGLRGRPDDEIRNHALRENLTLITGDIELGNLLRYAPSPAGILVVRLPETLSAEYRIERIVAAVKGLTRDDLAGCVGVIEVEDLRIRKSL